MDLSRIEREGLSVEAAERRSSTGTRREGFVRAPVEFCPNQTGRDVNAVDGEGFHL
jgi:hypothetical protein